MTELEKLIAEQLEDDKSSKVKPEFVSDNRGRKRMSSSPIRNFTSVDIDYNIRFLSQLATAEEIAQAKEDSICPRCNRMIFLDPEGVLCDNCGFSY